MKKVINTQHNVVNLEDVSEDKVYVFEGNGEWFLIHTVGCEQWNAIGLSDIRHYMHPTPFNSLYQTIEHYLDEFEIFEFDSLEDFYRQQFEKESKSSSSLEEENLISAWDISGNVMINIPEGFSGIFENLGENKIEVRQKKYTYDDLVTLMGNTQPVLICGMEKYIRQISISEPRPGDSFHKSNLVEVIFHDDSVVYFDV